MPNPYAELINAVVNKKKIKATEDLQNLLGTYGVKTPNELLSSEIPIQVRETVGNLIKDISGFEMPRTDVGGGIGMFPQTVPMERPILSQQGEEIGSTQYPSAGGFAVNQPKTSFVTPPPATLADFQRKLAGAEAKMFEPSKEAQIKGVVSEIKAREAKQQQVEAGSAYGQGLKGLVSVKKGISNITISDLNELAKLHPNVDPQDALAIQKGIGISPEEVNKNQMFNEANSNLKNALTNNIPLTLDWFANNMFKQIGPEKSLQIVQDFIPKATKQTLGDIQVDIVNKFRNRKGISPEEMTILIDTLSNANPIAGQMLQNYMIPLMGDLRSTNPKVKQKAMELMANYYRSIVTGFNFPELEKKPEVPPSGEKKIKVDEVPKTGVPRLKADFIFENNKMNDVR